MADGEYVDVESSTLLPTPDAPWNTVVSRFDSTLALANQMQELLVGADGSSGYLGDLNALVASAPSTSVSSPVIDTALVLSAGGVAPIFDHETLGDFPDVEYADPSLLTLPTIDLASIIPADQPNEVSATLVWSEASLPTDVYVDLLARIQADLQSGATGLTEAVENAIYTRAQQRQQVANLKAYNALNLDIVSRGFQMPSGALLSGLTEINSEVLRQETEINNQIVITNADLAQKNSQFIIQQAVALETLIRGTKDARDKNTLDKAKSDVSFVLQNYAEKVRAYIAAAEASKAYVEVQVENLKAVVESNKANVELYKEKYAALATRIAGVSERNKALATVYSAEVNGFGEVARADASRDSTLIEHLKTKIMAADQVLRAEIANAQNLIAGYTSESALREKIGSDMANIAAQTIASALNSVNASASIGYNGSESKGETWSHHESLSENHSYEHDPGA